MAKQLKQYQPGTPDYKKTEDDMLKKQGDLNLKVSLQKKDFMEQEGRIYFDVSREIDDAVKQLAAKTTLRWSCGSMAIRSMPSIATTFSAASTSRSSTTIRAWTSLRIFCRT